MKKLFAALLLITSPAFAEGEVVVSVKPLHSLVVAVMEGSGMEPELVVSGKTSLHDFSMKPSQAKMLRKAEVVLYMGAPFEGFLANILPQISAKRVAMMDAKGITILPVRGAKQQVPDLHLWLSPGNALAMTDEIASVLSEKFPDHAGLFTRNAQALKNKISALDEDLKKRMRPLSGKPFAAFHDAYQYFTTEYGLTYVGSVLMHAEHAPSAANVKKLREQIKAMRATCLFREPEYDAWIVENIAEGTGVKTSVLDPEATQIEPGAGLYFTLMEGIAAGLGSCLK